jgi:hypothetical protein
MKNLISLFVLAVFCLFIQENLIAQDEDTPYVIVEYMKVKPGMQTEYLECEKIWKTIHQYRKGKGLIQGWSLEEVVFPSGTNAEYDYLVVTEYKNWKAMGAGGSWYAEAMATLAADQREIAENATDYRDVVKREIWTAPERAFAKDGGRPLYIIENFMKVPTGGLEAWLEMETEFVMPVHEKSIALGIRAGWLAGIMVMPRGADYPYQVSTLDFFNTWEAIDNSEDAAWKAIHPDIDWDEAGKRFNAVRTIVKSEVRKLVYYTE